MGFNIRKDGPNRWFLDVRVRNAGHEIRKRETFTGSRQDAQQRYLKLRQELKAGPLVRISPRTFGQILEFYRDKRTAFSSAERGRYKTLRDVLALVPVEGLAERLEAFLTVYRRTPRPKTGKPPAGATCNRLVEMVRAAMNVALDAEWVDRNPITRKRFPKFKEVARDRVLTVAEEGRLLSVVANEAPHLLPVVRFVLQVPCRKSEVVNMRREDLDMAGRAIRVRNGTTKNDQGLWKPIPPDMEAYFASIPPASPWLFYRVERGLYAPLGDFRKAWKTCLDLAGISNFRFHDTRHISASRLLDNGTPEQVVMQAAGWRTNMLRTYYHRDGKRALELIRFSR